jgi:hypothetical protein
MVAISPSTSMSESLFTLCTPRKSVFESSRRDTVLDLTDLLDSKIDPQEFFAENYLTDGLKQLLRHGLRRLAGKSEQGVFVLSQSMGGGKTHGMLTLGLLALHADHRKLVLGEIHEAAVDPKDVRVIGFSGRESDAPHGVWGALAGQLGKKELFNDYYSPLQAPGQSAWINLLQGPPTLILLDELPPYFENAKSKTVGNSDLARVTTTALSNLLVALNKPELSNVCVVISDLKATYQGGSLSINSALRDLQNETHRGAMQLTPVALNSDDIFHILRKRLFENLPDQAAMDAVAASYAQSVKDARAMDLTSANPDDYRREIAVSYPFHFSLRDLYARFRENPGFQQTRALIRLMRVITSRLWETNRAKDQSLIHPYDIDLNHAETRAEIEGINSRLANAVAHDIASTGASVAEQLDRELGGRDCQEAASLLLVASLANVAGATIGLGMNDSVAFLCKPGRDIARLRKDVLGVFSTRAWYLHTDREGRMFFKDVQNVVAKLKSTAEGYTREIQLRELQSFLETIFKPDKHRDCYQSVVALTPSDELKLDKDHILLVIAEPEPGGGLADSLQAFYEDATYKNRVLFLTGEREVIDRLLERSAELKAIRGIIQELENDKTPDTDPQLVGARELRDKILLQLLSAAKEGFDRLHYPSKDGLAAADFLMNYQGNEYNGEAQIRDTLKSKQKFTEDIDSDTFRKKCEQRLFTQQVMDFAEVKRRSATNPQWQWHIPSALDSLKSKMLLEDAWRENGGLVDKGPFPPPVTSVRPQELKRDDATGEALLRLVPVHADKVHYEIGGPATTGSALVQDLQKFATTDLRLSFLAVDSTGQHDTGPPISWQNRISLKSRFFQQGKQRMCEILAAPPVPIYYTTDGSTPSTASGVYEDPFPVPDGTICVLAVGEKDSLRSEMLRADVPKGDQAVAIDPSKPAIWKRPHSFDTTKESYEFLAKLEKIGGKILGTRVMVGSSPWAEFTTDATMSLDRTALDRILHPLREIVGTGEVQLSCDGLSFSSGQDLLDWVSDHKTELREHEVSQVVTRNETDD